MDYNAEKPRLLKADGAKIQTSDLKILGSLSSLKISSFNNIGNLDNKLLFLSNLGMLEYLDLRDNRISDDNIKYLKRFNYLEHLDISENENLTINGIENIVKGRKNLKNFNLMFHVRSKQDEIEFQRLKKKYGFDSGQIVNCCESAVWGLVE